MLHIHKIVIACLKSMLVYLRFPWPRANVVHCVIPFLFVHQGSDCSDIFCEVCLEYFVKILSPKKNYMDKQHLRWFATISSGKPSYAIACTMYFSQQCHKSIAVKSGEKSWGLLQF